MKDYIIREPNMGVLSRTKGGVTDKYGNKRKHLVYWGNTFSGEAMKFFYITALLQYIMIKTFASDLKPYIVKRNWKAYEELREVSDTK